MSTFLMGTASVLLILVMLGLARILLGPGDADRLLAAQLLGTGGVAALLLMGVATRQEGVIDLAVVLALLAAFAALAFVVGFAAKAMANDEPVTGDPAWGQQSRIDPATGSRRRGEPGG
jgi:multicomponent Na+:H+ antiporter subunit F